MIAECLIVEQYRRAKAEDKKEGKREDIRESAAGEGSKWQAWYERQQASQRGGSPLTNRRREWVRARIKIHC